MFATHERPRVDAREISFLAVARELAVSGNAVRKHLRQLERGREERAEV
jgi:predicted ArsR family transcriptional regulator